MPFVFNDLRHWQERAADAREIAHQMNDLHARASMLAVAEQYEKIAERALDRLKAQAISRSLPVKSA
jgi:hypothetical protein